MCCGNICAVKSLPPGRLGIDHTQVTDYYFPTQQADSFKWGLEIGVQDDGSRAIFCKGVRDNNDPDEPILTIGPVVEVTKSFKEFMTIIVENKVDKKWMSLGGRITKFSPICNLEWLARGERSLVHMGFFPESASMIQIMTGEGPKMGAAEIEKGFKYVRKLIQDDSTGWEYPNTWRLSTLVENAALKTRLDLKWDLVFEGEFNEEECKRWISAEKKKARQKLKAMMSEESQRAGQGKRKADDKPLESRKKSKASKEQKNPMEAGGSSKEPEASVAASKKKVEDPSRQELLTLTPPPKSKTSQGSGRKLATKESRKVKKSVVHTNIVLHPEDDSCPQDAPEESDVLKGQEVLKNIEEYYTFGITDIFEVPIESILPPSAVFVYRMFNQQHALEVAKSMMNNPGQEPHVADLIPYLARTKKLLHFENTLEDRRAFRSGVKKREIQFLAISGQHSAKAAQWIQGWAEKDAKLTDLASKLKYRKARILSDRTPRTILVEHSSRSNAVNETMQFKSCFLETVVHARRQFDECGRPERPGIGANQRTKNSKYQVY